MAFDVITGIAQAEDAAKTAVQYAQAQANKMIAEARAEEKTTLEAALAKAENELRVLKEKSDEKSIEDAKRLRKTLETKKAVLRAGAEARLDAAAKLVAERIVNG